MTASCILVVDANTQVATATAQVLADAGYRSKSVPSFEQALAAIASETPDLVLTAVRLGSFNGIHLALRCQAEHPEIPILVLGVGADSALASEAAENDVRFMMMPANYSELIGVVREVLTGGVSPEPTLPRTDSDITNGVDSKSRSIR